jgi:hypothetical protein
VDGQIFVLLKSSVTTKHTLDTTLRSPLEQTAVMGVPTKPLSNILNKGTDKKGKDKLCFHFHPNGWNKAIRSSKMME